MMVGSLAIRIQLFVALLISFVVAESSWETGDDTYQLYKRVGPTTGCTCYTFNYQLNNGPYWGLLAGKGSSFVPSQGVNNEGWCFVNGVMTQTGINRLQTALAGGVNTVYVNVTWAKTICAAPQTGCVNCTPAQCATWIQNDSQNKVFSADQSILAPCTYPTLGFTPTDCTCSFTCNTAGYVVCGRSCINPATQSCVSGLPVSKNRRRGLALDKRQFVCPDGLSYCPLEGGGFECLNTNSDLESCGGCTYRPKAEPDTPLGVDCSAIPGVANVACVKGACSVLRCDPRHHLVNGTCESVETKQNFWAL